MFTATLNVISAEQNVRTATIAIATAIPAFCGFVIIILVGVLIKIVRSQKV